MQVTMKQNRFGAGGVLLAAGSVVDVDSWFAELLVRQRAADYVAAPPALNYRPDGSGSLPLVVVTGTLGTGNALTASIEAFTAAGYTGTAQPQWRRSASAVDQSYANSSAIAGATSLVYVQAAADEGRKLYVDIAGLKPPATDVGVVPASAVVVGVAPGLVAAPAVTSTPTVGQIISAQTFTLGTYSGTPAPVSALDSWLLDGSVVSTGYTLGAGDAGKGLAVRVAATNASGTFQATSVAVAVQAATLATGSLKSVTVRDSTIIDPRDIGSGVLMGPNGSGWVADVVLSGISSAVGAIDATLLLLTVNDPGYNSDGTATTRTRTIIGRQLLRRQWPNTGNYVVSASTDLLLTVALSDLVYQGSTVTSASILAGFWPGAVASSAASITNNSTAPYFKPVFGWNNIQHERNTGNTHRVEGVAFHRYPMNGQPVACIEYVTTAGTTRSSALSLSTLQTVGQISEVFAADIDTTGLTQGAVASINARVKPWIGDASSILDVAADGVAWPTFSPMTPLRVLIDRTGGYGGGYAYVRVGASGGAVSAVAATAAASPFPDIATAINALQAWNNTNRGHNDLGGGTIRLMDASGSAVTHAHTFDSNNPAGLSWLDIEKDPAATAAVTVTSNNNVVRRWPHLTRFKGGLVVAPGTSQYSFSINDQPNSMMAFDGVAWDNPSGKSTGAYVGLLYQRNLVCSAGRLLPMLKGANARRTALQVGVDMSVAGDGGDLCAPYLVGCKGKNGYTQGETLQADLGTDTYDGQIIYNCVLPMGVRIVDQTHTDRGRAFVQILAETTGATSSSFSYSSDGCVLRCVNVIEAHITAVGERSSRMYNDAIATLIAPSGMRKEGVSLYNVWDNINCKSENFANGGSPGVSGCGNWPVLYQVGCDGNVNLFGNVNRGGTPDPTGATDNYLFNAWPVNSSFNLQVTHSLSQAQIMALFGNYTAAPKAGPTVGGNYQPTNAANNPLHSRVPAGRGMLGRDLFGNARRQDGSGAAGAVERAA
jgi:hypothetical protein